MKKIDEGWNSIKKKENEYKLDRLIEFSRKQEFDIKKDLQDISQPFTIFIKIPLHDGKN